MINSIIIRASAQKMLPILIPALAALLRVGVGGGEDVDGEEEEEEEDEEEAEEEGEGDDESDEVRAAVVTVEENVVVNEVVSDAIAVALELPPSDAKAERPHVCGSAASFDVILNPGLLAQSSPAKSSICM